MVYRHVAYILVSFCLVYYNEGLAGVVDSLYRVALFVWFLAVLFAAISTDICFG